MTTTVPVAPTRRFNLLRTSRDWGVVVGVVLLIFVLAVGFLGPLLVSGDPTQTVGIPGQPPGGEHILGLDFQGRDVLSRLLTGGRSTLMLAPAAALLTYIVGVTVGLVAGYSGGILDGLLMRTVDVFLSIPALLVMLLCATGLGNNAAVLVLGATLVLFPGVARIVRSATLEIVNRGYVEAAVARGEPTPAVLGREVLPNISGPIIADFGARFSWSAILIASVNFLGLGIRPPTPDWAVMISENRVIIPTNPMSVVAPAIMLAALIIAINLIGDGLMRRYGKSESTR
jgi:ABC-type dipeptide/oligopeptide/nickel transport system permease subunit